MDHFTSQRVFEDCGGFENKRLSLWAVLVFAILADKSCENTAEIVTLDILKRFPSSQDLVCPSQEAEDDLFDLLLPVGDMQTKVKRLVQMSSDYNVIFNLYDFKKWNIIAMRGCNKYVDDVWKMFMQTNSL